MSKTILVTGATDGIGLETAKILASKGHNVLLHGRNPDKLKNTVRIVSELSAGGSIESYVADLSRMEDVETLAKNIAAAHKHIDVLINNAGVLKAPNTETSDGLDIRFVVNTIAPYLLTKRLLPLLDKSGRIINLSSAAQSTVNIDALTGKQSGLADMEAYSQSKLAITMWSREMADSVEPIIIAVNPGSLLASKMVKEGFGIAGNDISIGAEILVGLSLDDEFMNASGKYFDNDNGQFADPHSDALDQQKCKEVTAAIEAVLA